MEIVEILAIIILIVAIVFLIYYYVQSVNTGSTDIREIFSSFSTSSKSSDSTTINLEDEIAEKKSMGDKIKYTFKDIDKSYANTTDAFSKRLDTFLDERSEELIESWSLVTTDDLSSLEERCTSACESIDDLEKRFSEYSTATDERLEDFELRIKALEDLGEEEE